MPLTIRPATPADVNLVVDMNDRLAWESEHKKLNRDLLTPGVHAVLADAARGRYFMAERDGVVVGQTMITYEWSDWRNGWIWWIQSVYVIPEARAQGVFRALYTHILDTARKAGNVIGLRLYVEKENRVAHHTYQRMGMEWTDYLVMERCPLG